MKRLKKFTIIDGIVAFLSFILAFYTDYTTEYTLFSQTNYFRVFIIFGLIFVTSFGIFALCLFILLVSFFIKRSTKPLIIFLITDFILIIISGGVNGLLYDYVAEDTPLYHIVFTLTDIIIFYGFILFVYALLILIVTALTKKISNAIQLSIISVVFCHREPLFFMPKNL